MIEELLIRIKDEERVNIQVILSETLCVIANSLKGQIEEENKLKLFKVIEECQQSRSELSRYIAVYYSVHLFPFHFLPARYLCCISVIEEKSTIIDLLQKGLKPYTLESNTQFQYSLSSNINANAIEFPSFASTIQFFSEKYDEKLEKKYGKQEYVPDQMNFPFDFRIYREFLQFIHLITEHEIKNKKIQDNQSEDFHKYRRLIENALCSPKLLELHLVASKNLIQLLQISSEMREYYGQHVEFLWKFLFTGKRECRDNFLKIISIVFPFISSDTLVSYIKHLYLNLSKNINLFHAAQHTPASSSSSLASPSQSQPQSQSKEVTSFINIGNGEEIAVSVELIHSSISILGNIISRSILYSKDFIHDKREKGEDGKDTASVFDVVFLFIQFIFSKNSKIASAAYLAIGAIARYSPLPIPDRSFLHFSPLSYFPPFYFSFH